MTVAFSSLEVCVPVNFGVPLLMTNFLFSLIQWLMDAITIKCSHPDLLLKFPYVFLKLISHALIIRERYAISLRN